VDIWLLGWAWGGAAVVVFSLVRTFKNCLNSDRCISISSTQLSFQQNSISDHGLSNFKVSLSHSFNRKPVDISC